jgi:hypothetical protein
MNMNILELKKLGAFDIILLALFVVYIVFPVPTPQWLVPFIDSPFGMLTIFVVTLSLFVYRSPILGILYIFVAYELLRRNHYIPPASPIVSETQYSANRVPQKIPTQSEKDAELQNMNPIKSATLEEEVIAKESPVGVSQLPVGMETSFHPANGKSSLGMTVA